MKWITYYALLIASLLFPPIGNAGTLNYKLVCDEPICDFGKIDQSAIVTNVFTIRNKGLIAFSLRYIHTSCGCTRGRLDKRMIEPGESAKLTAIYRAARRRGTQKKALRIIPTGSSQPALTLYMQGVVEAP